MLTHTKLREAEFIIRMFPVTIPCSQSSAGLKLLLRSLDKKDKNAYGQTTGRSIKAAGMSRVSVEGAHALELNMQNDSSVRVKCVLTANQGIRDG